MRIITMLVVVLIGLVSCTLAAHMHAEAPDDIMTWYPETYNAKPVIPPEFAWIYLHNEYETFIQMPETKPDSPYSMENLLNRTAFHLYTQKNRDESQILRINDTDTIVNSNWNPLYPTKIIIHGYQTDYRDAFIQRMKEKLLDLDEYINVIAFDWGSYANELYPTAVTMTDDMGTIGAILIDILCSEGAKTSDFHLIGHSLGAHVAGFIAKYTSTGKIARVTGLDPAYPGFITEPKDGRLDSSDAEFVDCIHTCGGFIAFRQPICHADFYPNGGTSPQPGCSGFFESTKCSHSRSHELFIESIIEGHQFPAFKCSSVPDANAVTCKRQEALMGYPAQSEDKGIFYVNTTSRYPYAPVIVHKPLFSFDPLGLFKIP